MAWSTTDIVAFVTLIIAIPTSIAGVWTLHLHLQTRQPRRHRLADAISYDSGRLHVNRTGTQPLTDPRPVQEDQEDTML
ncbi:hypothetical protein BJX66DRAFT_311102 [Aspergillus keveii]|uniref:Uncharacterized protein n=1 Tax=Aspergillus keveii TaxID=714993 RepID=A0ABR4FWP7_9EURO